MGNGRETIQHRSHIRHNVTWYTKVTEKKVTFNLERERGEKDKEVKEEETKRKRGRPRKGEKAESNTDYKIGTESDTNYTIGIAARTCSKTPPDLADKPLKSSLKQRTQDS